MKFRKWTTIAITLAATLAITVSLSAQNNLNPRFKLTMPGELRNQAARAEISEAADQKIHLFLFVKVRENWADDPERYREMGLEFPKGG